MAGKREFIAIPTIFKLYMCLKPYTWNARETLYKLQYSTYNTGDIHCIKYNIAHIVQGK